MVAKTVKVKLTLDEIVCDPVQYKPYSPKFSAQDVIVEVPLDSELVEQDGDLTVLQLEGLQALLGKIANAVEDMHIQRQRGQAERHNNNDEASPRRSFTSRRNS
jgi:hypothetical protein